MNTDLMQWRSAPPDEVGWWWRDAPETNTVPAPLYISARDIANGAFKQTGTRWAGPLATPAEPSLLPVRLSGTTGGF